MAGLVRASTATWVTRTIWRVVTGADSPGVRRGDRGMADAPGRRS